MMSLALRSGVGAVLLCLIAVLPAQSAPADGLLTLRDMPTGYALGAPPAAINNRVGEWCGGIVLPLTGMESIDEASAAFERGVFGPIVRQWVALLPEAPIGITDRLWERWTGCTWETTSDAGITTRYRMAEMAFPALGDESVAFRLEGEQPNGIGAVAGDVVVIRRGTVVTALTHLVAGYVVATIDSTATERYARIIEGRLSRVP